MSNPTSTPYRWIQIELIGDTLLVDFRQSKLLDSSGIHGLGDELVSLAATARHVVLNFGTVELFASTALNKLIVFERRLQEHGGKLVLCALIPEIQELFQITRLSQYFQIVASVADALPILKGEQLGLVCPFLNCGHEETMPLVRFVDQGYRLQCSSCECQYRLLLEQGPHTESARVTTWMVPTYDGRSLKMRLSPNATGPHAIEMEGECDLYVADALNRLVHSLPGPPRVVVDVSKMGELTDRAGQRLDEIAAYCRHEGTFAIRDRERKEPPPFCLPASLKSPAVGDGASNAYCPPTEARPVMIQVRHFKQRPACHGES